jgi:hypothetical protein
MVMVVYTSTRAYPSPQHQDVAEIAGKIYYGNVRDFLNLTLVAIRGHTILTYRPTRPNPNESLSNWEGRRTEHWVSCVWD